MRIAIASGKGGTGKTTVAVSLALSAQEQNLVFVDCDVEAPNAYLFLKPEITSRKKAGIPVPLVDESLCNGCRKCREVCQFSAITVLGEKTVLTFPELCHGCGGCSLVCPTAAISETEREIGEIETGRARGMEFFHARLKVGEAMSPPLIRKLKAQASRDEDKTVILDCPPGTSCPMIESVKGADLCILVTEPTPFGLNDLELASGAIKQMKVPAAVIINRAGIGNGKVKEFCKNAGLPVWLEIPQRREFAEAYSRGIAIVEAVPQLKKEFEKILLQSLSLK
jgi:MinD superfamily P-loop ATPase